MTANVKQLKLMQQSILVTNVHACGTLILDKTHCATQAMSAAVLVLQSCLSFSLFVCVVCKIDICFESSAHLSLSVQLDLSL